jgi:hypothetical protein
MILSVYTFTLCMVTGLAHFCGVRMKFWWIVSYQLIWCMYSLTYQQGSSLACLKYNDFFREISKNCYPNQLIQSINSAYTLDLTSFWLAHFIQSFPREVFKLVCVSSGTFYFPSFHGTTCLLVLINTAIYFWPKDDKCTHRRFVDQSKIWSQSEYGLKYHRFIVLLQLPTCHGRKVGVRKSSAVQYLNVTFWLSADDILYKEFEHYDIYDMI